MKIKDISLNPKYDLNPFLSDGEIVAFNVDYTDAILIAIAKKPLDYKEEKKNWAIFPKTKPKETQAYQILHGINGVLNSFCLIENEEYNIHDIQLLPDNKILLVCSRSYYKGPNDFDKNGRIYSANGEFIEEILLGDGIQNTQSTKSGTIWTGFFDEGVFGNFGWVNPIGASGLIAWDSSGKKLYDFEPKDNLDHICDCYALNVISTTEAWCYYYTEFPLVKINKFEIKDYWNVPVSGSDSFAVKDNYVLFRGGHDEKSIFSLVELNTDHKSDLINNIELLDENGESMKEAWAVGRKNALYLLKNNYIYSITVNETQS